MLIYSVKKITRSLCLSAAFILVGYCSYAQGVKRNPLLPAFNQQIDFQSASPAVIKDAVNKAMSEAKISLAKIYAVPKAKRNFQNTAQAFDDLYNKVGMTDGIMSIFSNASADSSIRIAGEEGEQTLDKFLSDLNLDEKLYKAFKDYSLTQEAKALKGWKKKFIIESLEDFE